MSLSAVWENVARGLWEDMGTWFLIALDALIYLTVDGFPELVRILDDPSSFDISEPFSDQGPEMVQLCFLMLQ
jgi:hypothetical protein